MIERDHGEGGHWWVVAVHYPTALMAKRGWERINDRMTMQPGEEGIGVYRMTPKTQRGDIDSGAPEGVHPVVVVTLDENAAHKAQRLLRSGTAWTPLPGFADALILRRARVMLAQRGQGEGRLVIRRPDDRGARLDETGTMTEQEPGRG
jgi:hypothetical protein